MGEMRSIEPMDKLRVQNDYRRAQILWHADNRRQQITVKKSGCKERRVKGVNGSISG